MKRWQLDVWYPSGQGLWLAQLSRPGALDGVPGEGLGCWTNG